MGEYFCKRGTESEVLKMEGETTALKQLPYCRAIVGSCARYAIIKLAVSEWDARHTAHLCGSALLMREMKSMQERKLREKDLQQYICYLYEEERAASTIQKYAHALRRFFEAAERENSAGKTAGGMPRIKEGDIAKEAAAGGVMKAAKSGITKETVIRYKENLLKHRAASGVNGELAALNSFFTYMKWYECRVRPVRVQRRTYCDPDRELSREEYLRLVNAAAARKNERLALLMQTICCTGIRVSELAYLTVEAMHKGQMEVYNKGKSRVVFLPGKLCAKLRRYCKKQGICRGCVFITRSGAPLNRSNIWAMMKALCGAAHVPAGKVFPHNLRHLFARCFYEVQKDIEHLATILGHSNINTTRIYTRTSGSEHRRQIERLRLLI